MKAFFIIWVPQVFSWFGSQLVQFALIWWLTRETGSATVLTFSTIMGVLPQVLIGPFAGVLVDRWNRRLVMMIADAAIAMATILLALLFYLGVIQVWHVYIVMLVRAVGGLFHWPAMTASTSLMVPEEHLTRIGGLNQTMFSVVSTIAPTLGALLLEWLPIQGVLAIDVSTAVLAITSLFLVQVPQPAAKGQRADETAQMPFVSSILDDMRSGMQFIFGWKGLTILLLMVMSLNFLAWPLMSLVPILVTKHFGGEALELGWFQSAIGIGGLLGGLLLSVWGGFNRRIVTMMVALVLHGIGTMVVGLTPAALLPLGVAAWCAVGLTGSMFNAVSLTVLQANVPAEIQGRVLSFQLSVATAIAPVGLVVAGPVTDILGPQVWFLAAGVALTAWGIGGFFVSPLMQIESKFTEEDGVELPAETDDRS
jgi:DHA3 family macrolide efflux protein-like MFS transporter